MGKIKVNLDKVLEKKGLTSKELAEIIGITQANLSILKTGKAKGIRFATLLAICETLITKIGRASCRERV